MISHQTDTSKLLSLLASCLVISTLVHTILENIPTSLPLVEHSKPLLTEQRTCQGLSEIMKMVEFDTDILDG